MVKLEIYTSWEGAWCFINDLSYNDTHHAIHLTTLIHLLATVEAVTGLRLRLEKGALGVDTAGALPGLVSPSAMLLLLLPIRPSLSSPAAEDKDLTGNVFAYSKVTTLSCDSSKVSALSLSCGLK